MNFEPERNDKTGKWVTSTKARIKALIEEDVLSIRGAARRFEVSKLTIHNWMHVEQDQRPHTLWTERSQKLNKRDRQHLIRIVTASYEGWRLKWKELGQLTELNVSERTIKRACAKEGYHKCKACRKPFISVKTRQIWRHFARVYSRMGPDFWKRVMWSDECSFDTSRGTTHWVICTKGERYHSACCESVFKLNSKTIPIWGAIEYNWKSPLMILKEHEKKRGITMKNYKKQVLKAVVRPAFAEQHEWHDDELFQKNNASIHGSKRARSLAKWK